MMPNMKEMELKLTRGQVCDINLALTNLIIMFVDEEKNAETDTQKDLAERGLRKWRNLHDLVNEQLKEFDKENL